MVIATILSPFLCLIVGEWCPDCIDTVPNIRRILEIESNTDIVEIDVGTREEWRNQDHPLRKHSIMPISEIPTVVKCQKEQNIKSLSTFSRTWTYDQIRRQLLTHLLQWDPASSNYIQSLSIIILELSWTANSRKDCKHENKAKIEWLI